MSDETADARFQALYRHNYGRVLAYALRRTTSEVAHDVVADTFLVAWRRLDRVPDDPLPWLMGCPRARPRSSWASRTSPAACASIARRRLSDELGETRSASVPITEETVR